MPPIKDNKKKDWSIDEWLEESMERRRKYLKRKGKLWDRNLKGDTEIVLSSSEESTATEIIPVAHPRGDRNAQDPIGTCRAGPQVDEREFATINEIKAKKRGGIRACNFWNSSIVRQL